MKYKVLIIYMYWDDIILSDLNPFRFVEVADLPVSVYCKLLSFFGLWCVKKKKRLTSQLIFCTG